MKHLLLPLLVTLATAVPVWAEPELSGKPDELMQFLRPTAKTTTLTGEAEIKVPVDKAVASLRIVSEHKAFAEAVRQNNDRRAQVAGLLKKAGLPEDQIQGAKFSSTPSYSVFSDKAKSYRVENVVRVTVKDDKEFLAVAAAVDALSDVHFSGIEPEPGDAAAHKEKALAAALKNAADRKALLEQATGLVLKADSVGNMSVHLAIPEATRGRYSSRGFSGEQGLSSLAYTPDASPLAGGLGEVKINATVSITYTVAPK